MKDVATVKKRRVDSIVRNSVLWEQVSATVGDPNKCFLYFADKKTRLIASTTLKQLFPDYSISTLEEQNDAEIRFSEDKQGNPTYYTIKIPKPLADEMQKAYQKAGRYVLPLSSHGGVRLSDTYTGKCALSILEQLHEPNAHPRTA